MVSGLRARATYDQTPPPACRSRSLGPPARRRGGEPTARHRAREGTPRGGKCQLSPPLCAPRDRPPGEGGTGHAAGERGGRRSAQVGCCGAAGRRADVPVSPEGDRPRFRRVGAFPGAPGRVPVSPRSSTPPPPRPGAGPAAGIAFPRETARGSKPGGVEEGWPGCECHPGASNRRAASPRGAELGGRGEEAHPGPGSVGPGPRWWGVGGDGVLANCGGAGVRKIKYTRVFKKCAATL